MNQLRRSPVVVKKPEDTANEKAHTSQHTLPMQLKVQIAITQLATSIAWHEQRQENGFSREAFERWLVKHSEHAKTLSQTFNFQFENLAEVLTTYIQSHKSTQNISNKVIQLSKLKNRTGATWHSPELSALLDRLSAKIIVESTSSIAATYQTEHNRNEASTVQASITNATAVNSLSFDDVELHENNAGPIHNNNNPSEEEPTDEENTEDEDPTAVNEVRRGKEVY